MIDRIVRLPLRSIWKHEAADFTTWLCENIDVLNDVTGIELKSAEREQSTGNFNVDIRAEDNLGNVAIIENQLEKSDHDHLGKLITYLAAFEAKIAIWIVAEPRQEHITAINWLNEGGNGCSFYLLQLEAVKIGDSQPAPLITLIARPTEEAREVGKIKQEDSERHKLRYKFWELLLQTAKTKHPLFANISPTKDNWIGAGSGKSGLSYQYWVTKHEVRVELRIDKGKGSDEENLKIFRALRLKKNEIEKKFGESLIWDESDGDRKCSIRKELNNGGYRDDESDWPKITNTAVETMKRLEMAMKPEVQQLTFA